MLVTGIFEVMETTAGSGALGVEVVRVHETTWSSRRQMSPYPRRHHNSL